MMMIKRHQNYSESAAPLHGMGGPSLLDATNHESPLQGVGGPSILDATNHESRNVYDINYDCKRFAIANERTNLTCERSTQRALRAFHNLQTSLVIYIEQRVRVPPLTCDIDGAATTVMSVCRSVTYCVEMSVIWLLDDFCPSSPDIP